MKVPDKYMEIMAQFQRALKSDNHEDIDKIPLKSLVSAKAYFSKDKDAPYYSLLLDKIREKEAENDQHNQVSSKPLVFISYDTNDLPLVYAIDVLLKRIFGDKIETFIAKRDIKAGEDAFKKMLHESLPRCSVVLALCTLRSLASPWLWFEAGAGFGSSNLIPVWAGVTPNDFKAPMTIFQGKSVADRTEMNELMSRIVEILSLQGADHRLTNEEFDNLQRVSSSLLSAVNIAPQKTRLEDSMEFPLPYPKQFNEQRREGEAPVDYLIEVTFDKAPQLPLQKLLDKLEICKIKFRISNDLRVYNFPDFKRHNVKKGDQLSILSTEESCKVSNEVRQTALLFSPVLTLTHWTRHFHWGYGDGPKLINTFEIDIWGTRFLIFCIRLGNELKLDTMKVRIRLFNLQGGLLYKDPMLQGDESYQAPISNEVEIEQTIVVKEAKTKDEITTLLMHVWENFHSSTGKWPAFDEKKFLDFYTEEINTAARLRYDEE